MTDEMSKLFESGLNSDNEQLQVLRDLFTDDNIDMKTDLTQTEVFGLSKIEFIKNVFDIPILDSWTNKFIRLRVSQKRKGRAEFIDGMKAKKEELPRGFGAKFQQGTI